MHNYKHKITSLAIAVIATYFGFQALDLCLGIYQVGTYLMLAWYIFAFHVFWLVFIFDLHFKTSGHWAHAKIRFKGIRAFWEALRSRARHLYHWDYVKKYLHYLILPSVLYWCVVVLMYLNPFHELFKDGLIIITTAALAVVYWHFKEAFSKQMELHHTGLKVLGLVKLFAAYLTFSAVTAWGWYYGLPFGLVVPLVFALTFLLVYQALYQHRLLSEGVLYATGAFSLLVMLVFAVVYLQWNQNYYTAGLMSAVVYTICWGIMHKYLDRTLTRKLLWEYIFMLVVLISFILSTHDFQGRI